MNSDSALGTEAKEANRDINQGSTTITEQTSSPQSPPILKLRLKKDSKDKQKVVWSTDTVDNEHLGRKKSKCCCVFAKKRTFGESDTDESDDDCDNCCGHTPSDPSTKK